MKGRCIAVDCGAYHSMMPELENSVVYGLQRRLEARPELAQWGDVVVEMSRGLRLERQGQKFALVHVTRAGICLQSDNIEESSQFCEPDVERAVERLVVLVKGVRRDEG